MLTRIHLVFPQKRKEWEEFAGGMLRWRAVYTQSTKVMTQLFRMPKVPLPSGSRLSQVSIFSVAKASPRDLSLHPARDFVICCSCCHVRIPLAGKLGLCCPPESAQCFFGFGRGRRIVNLTSRRTEFAAQLAEATNLGMRMRGNSFAQR